MTVFVDRITRTERHPGYTGVNGNPRWIVYLAERGPYPTAVDAAVGYGINNSELRDGPVKVTLERGQIIYLDPA